MPLNLLDMFWLIVIGIVVLALAFIIAEVLFVPGGVLGIVGGLLLIYAVYLPYAEGYDLAAHINAAVIVIVLAVLLFTAIKKKSWRAMELKNHIDSKVGVDLRTKVQIGERGKASSRLTPIGSVRFDFGLMEAKSDEGFVDPGTEVEIIAVEQNEIIVKPINI